MEIDPARSTAIFRLVVWDLKNLKGPVLSPPCYVQNLPWKLMVMPRQAPRGRKGLPNKTLAVFLQCNADSKSTSWSCFAKAELRLISYNPSVAPFKRKIQKLFYSSENDWGFSQFITWSLVFEPKFEYAKDGAITVEVQLTAETPHGVLWDFKRYSGYVGLKFESISFYMNSVLQTLYFTNELRKAVYNMPEESDDSTSGSVLALQRLFYEMQCSDKQVNTFKLLRTFGLDKLNYFKEHDVPVLLKKFLDHLENKMKDSSVEDVILRLFRGKMTTYTKCKHVNVTDINEETYYGIELDIKGKKNIEESLEDYIKLKVLDGDNKFDAGEHGLQEALKGALFNSFPPVLHLHLMKFQYDPSTDGFVNLVKSNDLFEFYEHINLEPYLQERPETPADYTLHAVLVHSGHSDGGHYVAYIDPKGDGKWWKFDEEVISRCSKKQAIEDNYGGRSEDKTLGAYMLVYIRDSHLKSVLQDVTRDDIPSELKEKLTELMSTHSTPEMTANGDEIRAPAIVAVQVPECPVCLELLSAPIYQCQSGHSLCNICSETLDPSTCPICREPLTEIRNWLLEDIISQITSSDSDSEMDDTRPTGTFSFTINNFNRLKDKDVVLSPPVYVRNLPWKIMVSRRISLSQQRQNTIDSLAIFLQCNGDSESMSWSCHAKAELRIICHKPNTEPFTRKIQHLFYGEQNDWGFAHFMAWEDAVNPDKGYIVDNSLTLEAYVVAESAQGVEENLTPRVRATQYAGLRNEGATCYMNSLLQTLFFTNELRKAVYKMPTESDDTTRSVGAALQRVFYELQTSCRSVSASKLIHSFGWDPPTSFTQRDGQEFLRLLLDKIEGQMKDTCVSDVVPKLFEGKMAVNINCKDVKVTSVRVEPFYDIQLDIKGNKNIHDSFRHYTKLEILDGDNKYDAGKHGLQRAEKRVKFEEFPPVLHLHLMRFQYDHEAGSVVKSNDRFEFYEHINLDPYLEGTPNTSYYYTLHAVLVHSGDSNGGHYVAYIDPRGDEKWWKFDDQTVCSCTKREAISDNYGHDEDAPENARHSANAYMLIYIKDSAMKTVLQDVTVDDIPTELSERLAAEIISEKIQPDAATACGSSAAMTVHIPECPACSSTISPPIYQCKSGHSLCHTCTQNLDPAECPICRDPVTHMRNYLLEEIITKSGINKLYHP